jgi:hypothetical protein
VSQAVTSVSRVSCVAVTGGHPPRFIFKPYDGSCPDLDPARKTVFSLDLVNHGTLHTGDIAHLREPKQPATAIRNSGH